MLDVAVIGCGIVGANVAYLLSQHKLRAAVFEKENDVSMGTTRANSAIVHAGYDPEPGTAMARLNVRGSALTKEQCAAFDVKYRQIGSLVLAFSDEEMATVRRLYENGVANGVPGVRVLTREETLAMEPNLSDAVCGALRLPTCRRKFPRDIGKERPCLNFHMGRCAGRGRRRERRGTPFGNSCDRRGENQRRLAAAYCKRRF